VILLLKGQVQGYLKQDGTCVGPHFRSAARFAAKKHKGQLRDDGKTPYITHPLMVARILRLYGGNDPHTLAAALLHDTVEDTDATYEELAAQFGDIVAGVVREVSNDPSLPKAAQKQAQIDRAPLMSARATDVKLADKTANLISILEAPPNWPLERKRAYFEHAAKVVAAMKRPNSSLLAAFNTVLAEGRARLS
jgi:guanosine-3',5'-bis(diphosphate) 3'-pyrophosphohydrolase